MIIGAIAVAPAATEPFKNPRRLNRVTFFDIACVLMEGTAGRQAARQGVSKAES
jgi:hypothetical protein